MSKLTAVSLFSGSGGSDMGAKQAGIDIIFANDNSPNAVATYLKYRDLLAAPGAEIKCGDIANVRSFPLCDLVIGSYPCQSFSMGGRRNPETDLKSQLFLEFKRCLEQTKPKYFVVENVGGMAWLNNGQYLRNHVDAFESAGQGYVVTAQLLNAKDYGVPADRKRIFIVGVRRDLELRYSFPNPTHGPLGGDLPMWKSHGEAIEDLNPFAECEYYDRHDNPFPWFYLSRNRKRQWDRPSYTISGNWRHVPLHPASPTMHMVESNLSDGWKQKWEFTSTYDHLDGHPDRPYLDTPRRLTWRECAAIQTFGPEFEPVGSIQSKFRQIGNAVPPLLMKTVLEGIVNGSCVVQN